MSVEKEERDKAISFLKESLKTHQEWITFYDADPSYEAKYWEIAGDRLHHMKCVEGYTHAISILEVNNSALR